MGLNSLSNSPLVGDEAVHKELGDRMERAATTASSLEAEQDNGSGPKCQDTILGDVDAQTRFETTSKQSNDPPLLKVNTFGSGDDNMQLMELMTHCTKLSALFKLTAVSLRLKLVLPVFAAMHQLLLLVQVSAAEGQDVNVGASYNLIDKKKVIITEASIRNDLHLDDAEVPSYSQERFSTQCFLDHMLSNNRKFDLSKYIFDAMVKHLDGVVRDLEKAKSDQAIEIASLKKRVDKLEKRRQFSIEDIDAYAEVTLVNEQQNKNLMIDTVVLDDDEVFVDVASSEKNEQSTKLDDSTTGEAVTTASVEDSAAPTIQVSTANIGEVTAAKDKCPNLLKPY
ncbi:hypothetical protein Tco_0891661 [Tanacetum coccineum]|uniref:Uncharacterized protein n=1 Tax=Tanacetum coccineum TaxID=301880 RepID=A0ABQ5C5B4_9ASTR